MAEIVVWEKKFKEGEGKIVVDQEKKLMKSILIGKFDDKEFEEWSNSIQNESKKSKKGEFLYLHDGSHLDMRLYSNVQTKIAKDALAVAISHYKKSAFVFTSFTHQKSVESAGGASVDNFKYFSSVQEAMKWLMN